MTDDALRDAAIKNLKKKADVRRTTVIFLALWALFVVIWAVTGMGYFWPVWPILGMGIALVIMWFDAYRAPQSSTPSEAQIADEMKRMQGGSPS